MRATAGIRSTELPHPAAFLAALFAAMLFAAGCDKTTEPSFGEQPETINTIAYLKSRCDNRPSVPITEQIVVQGVVTANDCYGEFSRELVIEDASGGISIALSAPEFALSYPFGALVTVYCNGLTLTRYGGGIRLGTAPTELGPGFIPGEDAARYLHREAMPAIPRTPALYAFSDITQRQTDTYVRFDNIRFTEPGLWCERDPQTGQYLTTVRQIIDAQGRTFRVRTLGACSYAKEPVPQGTGSLCGVIEYFGGEFALRVTNREARFATAATPPRAYPSSGQYSAPKPKR